MSRIPVHNSLQVARKVLREVEKIIPKEIAKECSLESWSNCREQGISIVRYPRTNTFAYRVCVAECRNSDEILTIHGTTHDFDNQTNQPNEETYFKNRMYFRYDDITGAAKHIVKVLRG